MNTKTCPICNTEAEHKVHTYFSYWYCPKCKEDIDFLHKQWIENLASKTPVELVVPKTVTPKCEHHWYMEPALSRCTKCKKTLQETVDEEFQKYNLSTLTTKTYINNIAESRYKKGVISNEKQEGLLSSIAIEHLFEYKLKTNCISDSEFLRLFNIKPWGSSGSD